VPRVRVEYFSSLLKKLFADESFVNLLRAEGLDTLPKYLSDRISATTPQPELEGENA